MAWFSSTNNLCQLLSLFSYSDLHLLIIQSEWLSCCFQWDLDVSVGILPMCEIPWSIVWWKNQWIQVTGGVSQQPHSINSGIGSIKLPCWCSVHTTSQTESCFCNKWLIGKCLTEVLSIQMQCWRKKFRSTKTLSHTFMISTLPIKIYTNKNWLIRSKVNVFEMLVVQSVNVSTKGKSLQSSAN